MHCGRLQGAAGCGVSAALLNRKATGTLRRTCRGRQVLRRLYDWTIILSKHPRATPALAAIAFVESSIFPIPPDAMLIPMVLAAPERAWRIATVATLASVAGGFAGYAIGYLFFETIGQAVLDFYGYAAKFAQFREAYNAWGVWIVAAAGFTPFPYKVITIASGVTGLDLWSFAIASVLSRGGRFFLVAALLWRFGPPLRTVIEKHLGLLTTLFFALLFGGFLVARYLL